VAKRPPPSKAPVPTASPTARKRRQRPDAMTPRERLRILGLAVLLIVAALVISHVRSGGPPPPEEAEVKVLPAPQAPAAPTAAPAQSGTAQVARGPERSVPAALGAFSEPGALRPLQDVVAGAAVTPEQVDKRIETLLPYCAGPVAEERPEAYKLLVALGPELAARLPKLIETADNAALASYANAVRELKAVKAAPALIARLDDQAKPAVAQSEMLQALASLDDPTAREYMLSAMKGGKKALRRDDVWEVLGAGMDQAQLECAFQTVTGGGPEASLAAKALGRYGSARDKAGPLAQRIQQTLYQASGKGKLALVQALAAMHPDAAGSTLAFQATDQDPEIRAAALSGLARDPLYVNSVVEALRQDKVPAVRLACARALAENPSELALPEFIAQLNDSQLRPIAHHALVMANKGGDLGTQDFVWRDWLAGRQGKRQPPPEELLLPPEEDAP